MNPKEQSLIVNTFLHTLKLLHATNWSSSSRGHIYRVVSKLDTPTLYILLLQMQSYEYFAALLPNSSMTNITSSAKITIGKTVDLLTEELTRRYPDERTPR